MGSGKGTDKVAPSTGVQLPLQAVQPETQDPSLTRGQHALVRTTWWALSMGNKTLLETEHQAPSWSSLEMPLQVDSSPLSESRSMEEIPFQA